MTTSLQDSRELELNAALQDGLWPELRSVTCDVSEQHIVFDGEGSQLLSEASRPKPDSRMGASPNEAGKPIGSVPTHGGGFTAILMALGGCPADVIKFHSRRNGNHVDPDSQV